MTECEPDVARSKNAIERSVYRLQDKDKQITQIAFDPFDSPFRLRESLPRDVPERATKAATRRHVLPVNLKERIGDIERELVTAALDRAKFNQRVAANLLGLSYHQLRGKIRKHDLDVRNLAQDSSR